MELAGHQLVFHHVLYFFYGGHIGCVLRFPLQQHFVDFIRDVLGIHHLPVFHGRHGL